MYLFKRCCLMPGSAKRRAGDDVQYRQPYIFLSLDARRTFPRAPFGNMTLTVETCSFAGAGVAFNEGACFGLPDSVGFDG